jgi:polyphosphate kinase
LLQEASDPSVRLLERLRFLGIYSNNLDEFFRVRVASLKRLSTLGSRTRKALDQDPDLVLAEIQKEVLEQEQLFRKIYRKITSELRKENIFLLTDEGELSEKQVKFAKDYFSDSVRPSLMPVMLDQIDTIPGLSDSSIHLAVVLQRGAGKKTLHALVEIPSDLERFVRLPSLPGEQMIIFLDDVIRLAILELFPSLGAKSATAFSVKITRDAELDVDDDMEESLMRKVTRSLRKRRHGEPVRMVYDEDMPKPLLETITRCLQFDPKGSHLIPGSRHQNHKDLMNFPSVGPAHLRSTNRKAIPHPAFDGTESHIQVLKNRDVLLQFPYQPFEHVLDLIRAASIDPKVTRISMTLYRVARSSNIINALINASRNRKKVTVVLELLARFDEENNIHWSNRLQEEGVRVLHGPANMKVHSKLLLIERVGKSRKLLLAGLGTGNFNESTAAVYSDHLLLTGDARLTEEVERVFQLLETGVQAKSFEHLWLSPTDTRRRLSEHIERERKNALAGKPARITLKVNNLTDRAVINELYAAGEDGVEIRLMVRGMCSLLPDGKTITGYAIVDRYLEHTRIFEFLNDGEPRIYLSSADMMARNLDRRIEVTTPIYDPNIKAQIQEFLELQWADNVKSRVLSSGLQNRRRRLVGKEVRAQDAIRAAIRRQSQPSKSVLKAPVKEVS